MSKRRIPFIYDGVKSKSEEKISGFFYGLFGNKIANDNANKEKGFDITDFQGRAKSFKGLTLSVFYGNHIETQDYGNSKSANICLIVGSNELNGCSKTFNYCSLGENSLKIANTTLSSRDSKSYGINAVIIGSNESYSNFKGSNFVVGGINIMNENFEGVNFNILGGNHIKRNSRGTNINIFGHNLVEKNSKGTLINLLGSNLVKESSKGVNFSLGINYAGRVDDYLIQVGGLTNKVKEVSEDAFVLQIGGLWNKAGDSYFPLINGSGWKNLPRIIGLKKKNKLEKELTGEELAKILKKGDKVPLNIQALGSKNFNGIYLGKTTTHGGQSRNEYPALKFSIGYTNNNKNKNVAVLLSLDKLTKKGEIIYDTTDIECILYDMKEVKSK